jgi:SAM-dependent methyltransferase
MTEITYEGNDLEVLADMPNYYSWIMETFAPCVSGHVVEYGAGAGTVSERLAPLASELTLVEPSINLVSLLRARFAGDLRTKVVPEGLESHSTKMAAETVDTVVMVNVLEHIEDDQAALNALVHMMRSGGHLLIFVPALQFLMSKFDHEVEHFRRYHKPDLVAKVRAAGAKVRDCRYFDLPGVLPWLILNKFMGSTSFNPTLVGLNDRFVVPASRLLESWVQVPFGKNLILVAQKS